MYPADILRVSKASLTERYQKKNSKIAVGLDGMWREEQVRRAGSPTGVGSPLKKCAGEQREPPGYARPHLYDGYEVFVTFLLKHHSR